MKQQWVTLGAFLLAVPILYGGCNDHCGNAVLEPNLGEQCDDGNGTPVDGCSATCQIETAESCPTSTETAFAAAAASEPEVATLLGIAAGLNYGTTGSNVLAVYRCTEGTAAVGWTVVLKSTRNNRPNGALVWRTDAPLGRRVIFVYGSDTSAAPPHRYIEYVDFTVDVDHSGGSVVLRMVDRGGHVWLPKPPALTAPLPPAPPSTEPAPSSTESEEDGDGFPSPGFLGRLFDWIEPRAAWGQTFPADSCGAIWLDYMQRMADGMDASRDVAGHCVDRAISCVMSLGVSCVGVASTCGAVLRYTPPPNPPYKGAACTTLDCTKGACAQGGPNGASVGAHCVAASPPVSDCNAGCGEQCETTTGVCRGIKFTSVTPITATDSTVWRCGGATTFPGYDCPDGSDPAWIPFFTPGQTYTPQLTAYYCGRPSKTAWTNVTFECGPPTPGWVCTQGSSYGFPPPGPPNPLTLPNPWKCCSGGYLPLPQTFGQTLVAETGGVISTHEMAPGTCVSQPGSCRLCDCTPSGASGVGDPVDNPVCGFDGFQCPD